MYFGFENITIAYDKKIVLKNLSMEVPKGKIVTLIGQNGCGKSSLLKIISRVNKPVSGDVIFCGKSIKAYKPKLLAQKIAYLSQIHSSPLDIDVNTLVSYGRYPYTKLGRGLSSHDRSVIENSISLTGLEKLKLSRVCTLSGGERQRAWIAMTIAQQPEILILDEPTTYLDIGYQMEILELVKQLNQKLGITILMVLHDLNLAARYSDYLYIIKDGSLYAKGTPENILTEKNLRDVFFIESFIKNDTEHSCPYFIPHKALNKKERITI